LQAIVRDGWRRAGFELAIVFLGVLVALMVDGWNERRMERDLEEQYLTRLSQDVARDTAEFGALVQTLEAKSASLRWLQALAPGDLGSEASAGELARQLVRAHSAGFGVLSWKSTTFEDLRSTGNLSLVRDPRLRAQIVSYYEVLRFNAQRVEARRSEFPPLAYSVLPPAAYDTDVYFDAPSESSVELDLDVVADQVLGAGGRRALAGELNYARFFSGVVRDLVEQATELLLALAESPS
jgi:hypothetical protein